MEEARAVLRSDLVELHYIAPIDNVASILARGILCHRRAQKHRPASVAMAEVQARREARSVPGGLSIHSYACLYICARNPMLFKVAAQHQGIAVLRVSADALDLPGAIITDGNAASDYTAFYPSPDGLAHLDRDAIFAEWWTDPDPYAKMRKKRAKCAELLVPEMVPRNLILGAYVSSEDAAASVRAVAGALPLAIDRHLFFLP
jgi:hypothetical protein